MWAGAVAIEERRDDQVALRDVLHALPNVLHHTKKLMTNRAPHRIVGLPTIVPEVRTADACQHDANDRVGRLFDGRVWSFAKLNGEGLFFAHIHLHGGPATVRRYLPELIDLVWNGKINPGKVFDLELPMAQVAEGYRAMDERRAIKALLWP